MPDPNLLALKNPYLPLTENYWQWSIGFWAAFDEAATLYDRPTPEELSTHCFSEGYLFGAQYAGLSNHEQAPVPLEQIIVPNASLPPSDKIKGLAETIAVSGNYPPIKVQWHYQSVTPFWVLHLVSGEDTWHALKVLGYDQIKVVFGASYE